MKLIYKISITATIIVTTILSSCSGDYLNIEDKQNLTETSFWATKEHANQGIIATYAALQGYDGSKWTFFEEMYTSLAYKADDMDNNKTESYSKTIANFTNGTEVSGPYSVWASSYAGIGRANQVIQKVPGIKNMSDQERNQIIGEAKFLRAYNYFMLVNAFENVPLVLTTVKDLTQLQVPQAKPEQIWEQIEKDLLEAQTVLPTAYNNDNIGRATKGAATAFLAKVYLFREKWTLAETKFKEIYGQYSLNANYEDNFNGKGENGNESIFEIQFSGDRTLTDERHPFNFELKPSAIDGWELLYPSDWLVSELKTDLKADGSYTDRVYGTIFFNDPKSEIWDLNQPANLVSYASIADNLNKPNYFKKYTYPTDRSGSYIGVNISVIRYADVLLMLAEALNENGKTNEAIQRINEVRTRSGAVAIASGSKTKDELREWIRNHERPIELSMEWTSRWFDLVRWQRGTTAKQSIKATLTAHTKPFSSNYVEDKHIRFAIPSREIKVNPKLVQNNGY
jgi:hypothetical protein